MDESKLPDNKPLIDFDALNTMSYGIYIISTMDGERPVGCIANVCSQVTAEPIMLCLCLHHDNYTNKCLKEHGRAAISVMGEDMDTKLVGTFGFKSGKDTDKFTATPFSMIDALPVPDAAVSALTGTVVSMSEIVTHTLFVLKLETASLLRDGVPMTYDFYRKVIKMKTAKNAPTYIKK